MKTISSKASSGDRAQILPARRSIAATQKPEIALHRVEALIEMELLFLAL
jgi:hypothetical protein